MEKKPDSAKYSHNRLPICIRDSTHHYGDVKLVWSDVHCDEGHGGVLSSGVSPRLSGGDLSLHSAELSSQVAVHPLLQRRQLDDWKRKLLHLRNDAALKRNLRNGIVSAESRNWSEGYVRRSVKKKMQKSMFCEVCGVKIASYLEVGAFFSCDAAL